MSIDLSTMDAAELDKLIEQAAQRRESLQPEVAQERPTGAIAAVSGPAWYVEPLHGGTALQIRHPGFGWLAFVIPAEHRAQLLGLLLQQALLANVHGDNAVTGSPAHGPAAAGSGGGSLH